MMFPSHLLATLIGCMLLSFVRPMSPRDWLLALGFGVAIDFDHLLQIPRYVATHGWSHLQPATILHWGGAWQGFMHTPWALLVVVPACFVFSSFIPAAFWGLHMVQDFVVARHFVVFGSPTEWAIIGVLGGILAALLALDHQRHGAGTGLKEHVFARIAMVLPRR